jgi:hypothetical protein
MLQFCSVARMFHVHHQTLDAFLIVRINSENVFYNQRIGGSLQPSLTGVYLPKLLHFIPAQRFTNAKNAQHPPLGPV